MNDCRMDGNDYRLKSECVLGIFRVTLHPCMTGKINELN
jgi:hypothetical protein